MCISGTFAVSALIGLLVLWGPIKFFPEPFSNMVEFFLIEIWCVTTEANNHYCLHEGRRPRFLSRLSVSRTTQTCVAGFCMTVSGGIRNGPRNICLNFGDDLDRHLTPGAPLQKHSFKGQTVIQTTNYIKKFQMAVVCVRSQGIII